MTAPIGQATLPLQWPLQSKQAVCRDFSPIGFRRSDSSTRIFQPVAAPCGYPQACCSATLPPRASFGTDDAIAALHASPQRNLRFAVPYSYGAALDPLSHARPNIGVEEEKETQALLTKVQTVSSKAEHILVSSGCRMGRTPTRQRNSATERFSELTERLGRLEHLLDEVSALGSLRPVSCQDALNASNHNASSGSSTVGHPGWGRASVSNGGSASVTIPLMAMPQQRANSYSIHPGAAPPPSSRISARVEASPAGGRVGHIHLAGAVTPPPSFLPNRSTTPTPAARVVPPAPSVHRPGTVASGVRSNGGSFHLNGPRGAESHLPTGAQPTTSNLDSRQGGANPSSVAWGHSWHPPGTSTPMSQRQLVTPRAIGGACTPRASGSMTAAPMLVHPPEAPVRAISAPLQVSPPAPPGVMTVRPPPALTQPMPLNVGVFADGLSGLVSQVPTPMPPVPFPPAGPWMPPSGQVRRNSVNQKIREWLKTIPIGNGAERGWDDAQIAQIAEFAQEQHLEHLEVEDIYRRYVDHQVDLATKDD